MGRLTPSWMGSLESVAMWRIQPCVFTRADDRSSQCIGLGSSPWCVQSEKSGRAQAVDVTFAIASDASIRAPTTAGSTSSYLGDAG